MFANFYDRNEVTILLFEKQKNTENEKIAADYYLIEQIQPQGGITFNDERYIQTGNSYECCLHIYELPEKVNDNWLKELTDKKEHQSIHTRTSEPTRKCYKLGRSL